MSTLTVIIAGLLGVVGFLMAVFGGGRRIGRQDERAKRDAETLGRIGKGQDAASAARGKDADSVVEGNDARW